MSESTGLCAGSSSSSSCMKAKTRSAAAAIVCTWPITWAIWERGWVKLRTYWMKARMSPTAMWPAAARAAPSTTTSR